METELLVTGCKTPIEQLAKNHLSQEESDAIDRDQFNWPPDEANLAAEDRLLSLGMPVFKEGEEIILIRLSFLINRRVLAGINKDELFFLALELRRKMLARAETCGVVSLNDSAYNDNFIRQIKECRAKLAATQDIK